MFKENLVFLRKLHQMTQEYVADKVGVSRQALAKWESGETTPDFEKSRLLAEVFDVSLDDLASHESSENFGLNLPPKGKHIFGVATVGDKVFFELAKKIRKMTEE